MRVMFKTSRVGAAALAVALAGGVGAAQGQVVWSDNFDSGETLGQPPVSDFTSNGTPDYVASGDVSGPSGYAVNAVGNPGPGLLLSDINGTAAPVLTVPSSQWAPFTLSAANNVLRVGFDFRVDSFETGTANAAPRLVLRDVQAANRQFIIGFGRTTSTAGLNDGDSVNHDLALAAEVTATGTSSLIGPSDTNAIGLNAGVGWDPGFDFGSYDGITSLNDTHDQFYRIVFDYNFTTGAITGTATNAVTNESTGFNRSMNAGLTFASGSILLAAAGPSLTQTYFDNIEVSVVPEPATASLLLAGAGLSATRRRRRV